MPDTDEPIDVVVKATSMCCEEAILARYGAAGTLVLLGNNADGGVDAPNCTGTIWSVGNKLGGSWKTGNPYALGPRARAFVAGDFWETVKPADPYVSPGNAFLSPDELQARGRRVPENVTFLPSRCAPPPFTGAGAVPAVTMPIIENVAELLPSVRTYGAKGDGKADDTDALQKALTANRNQALYLPPGQYRITRPLLLDYWNGGWLVGSGPDRTAIINVDGPEDGVVRTDGCGFAAFQDIAFVARKGSEAPAFDLSRDPQHPSPPDFLGAGLQGNVFYRCRFVGGRHGLSIGRERFMGDTSLIADCDFESCVMGVGVRTYNALMNTVLRCLFSNVELPVAQDPAGSFSVLQSRFQGGKGGLWVTRPAGDAFWIYDTSSTSPLALATGNTGGAVNVLLDGFRYENETPAELVRYHAGGTLVFLDSDLGAGTVLFGGNVAYSALLLLRARLESEDQIELTHPRAQVFVLDGPAQ